MGLVTFAALASLASLIGLSLSVCGATVYGVALASAFAVASIFACALSLHGSIGELLSSCALFVLVLQATYYASGLLIELGLGSFASLSKFLRLRIGTGRFHGDS